MLKVKHILLQSYDLIYQNIVKNYLLLSRSYYTMPLFIKKRYQKSP